MAIQTMTRAVSGQPASSADYNTVLDNVEDVDSRLTTVSAAVQPVLFRGEITLDQFTNDAPEGTGTSGGKGLNVNFTAAGRRIAINKGGWSTSGSQVIIPASGVYSIVAQVVWSSQSAIGTVGVYATYDGTAGGDNGIATNETKSRTDGVTVIQASGIKTLSAGHYVSLRLWTDVANQKYKGVDSGGSYGGTYLTLNKISD